jgi:flagellar protein FlaG
MVEESESLGSLGAIGPADSAPSYDSAPSTPATSTVALAQQSARQPSAQEIQDAVKQVNERLASANRVLEFGVDAGSGLTVATIRDSQTGDVIEQYPGTDSIHLAQMLQGWAAGKNILLDLIA